MAVGIDLHLFESSSIAVGQSASESLLIGATDTTPNLVILTLVSTTESCAIQGSESVPAPTRLISVTDDLTVGLTDLTTTLFKSTEGIPLHSTDLATIAVIQTLAETDLIGTIESVSLASTLAASDSLLIGVTDASPLVPLIVPVTDTLLTVASDTAPTVNTGSSSTQSIAATDSNAVGLADTQPTSLLTVSISDSCQVQNPNVGIYEDVSIFAFTPQQFVSVSVTDTCVVQVITPPSNTTFISANDNLLVNLVEPESPFTSLSVSDTLRYVCGDLSAVFTGGTSVFTLATTDACAVQGADSAPSTVKTFWELTFSVADALALPVSEASTLASDLIALATLDSTRLTATDIAYYPTRLQSTTDITLIQAVEPTDAFSQPAVFDSPALQLADAFPLIAGSFSFNVADAVAVQETESTPVFPLAQSVSASESMKLVPVEGGPLVASSVLAADLLGCGLNDASLLVLKFIQLTDSLSIPLTDAAVLFNNFIALAATESATIQAGEIVTFVQQSLTQLATSDSLILGSDEQFSIASTQTLDEVLLSTAQELVDVLRSLSLIDAAAYRIASEDANIINPFVVNSTLSVDDFVTSDVLEVNGGQPSQLSFFVVDDLLTDLDDVTLTENLDLPSVQDFMIDNDFQQLVTPQSFRVAPSKYW